MCYHFKDSDTKDYIEWFMKNHPQYKSYTWQGARYYINGFAHGKSYVAKQGGDAIEMLEWGLIPFWIKTEKEAKEIANRTLNAKSETVFNLPSFRHCIKKQKCLIIANGFYEWRHINSKTKIPYLIGVRDPHGEDRMYPFTFGGIFDTWVNKDTGEVHETFSIITTPANSMMAVIHNSKLRMPLIIPDDKQQQWLNATDTETINALMQPFPADRMIAYPVSKLVSQQKVERNVPEVVQPEEYSEVSVDEFL